MLMLHRRRIFSRIGMVSHHHTFAVVVHHASAHHVTHAAPLISTFHAAFVSHFALHTALHHWHHHGHHRFEFFPLLGGKLALHLFEGLDMHYLYVPAHLFNLPYLSLGRL